MDLQCSTDPETVQDRKAAGARADDEAEGITGWIVLDALRP